MATNRKAGKVVGSKGALVETVAAAPQQAVQTKLLYRVEVKVNITRVQSDENVRNETCDCDYHTVYVAAEDIQAIQQNNQAIIDQACSGYKNRDAVKGVLMSINVQEGSLLIV